MGDRFKELPVATRRILIVEDESMIAMLVQDFLEESGWEVAGWAGRIERALALAWDAEIDAAVLDLNLGGQDTFAVADILRRRQIPFVFATGYGADGVAERFRGVPTLTKPFRRDEMDKALETAMSSPAAGQFNESPSQT
jgi:DNA-binding response OmpR family regulator